MGGPADDADDGGMTKTRPFPVRFLVAAAVSGLALVAVGCGSSSPKATPASTRGITRGSKLRGTRCARTKAGSARRRNPAADVSFAGAKPNQAYCDSVEAGNAAAGKVAEQKWSVDAVRTFVTSDAFQAGL